MVQQQAAENAAGEQEKPSLLLYLSAFLVMPFVELARSLTRRAYSGCAGALRACFGGVLALSGGSVTGCWALGQGCAWYLWLPAATAAGMAVYFYLWPAFYLMAVRPVCQLVEWIEGVLTKHLESLCRTAMARICRLCPGSGPAWSRVLEAPDGFPLALAHLSVLAGVAYLARAANQAADRPGSELTLGLLVGALSLWRISWALLEAGKLPLAALTSGLAAGAWAGSQPRLGPVGYLLGYLVYVGYLFPGVCLLLSHNWWSRLGEQIQELCSSSYADSDPAYPRFFHHLVGLAVAVGLIGACQDQALAAPLAWFLTLKLVRRGGTWLVGGVASLLGAVGAARLFPQAPLPAGLGVALLVCCPGFPLFYLALRALTRGLTRWAQPLEAAYAGCDRLWLKLLQTLDRLWIASFGDQTSYRDLFLHLANLVVAALVYRMSCRVGGPWAWAVLPDLAAMLAYLFVGRLLLQSDWGIWLVMGSLAVAPASWVGGWAGWATWLGLIGLVFPAAYLVVRALTGWALAGWLGPLLASLHARCWAGFRRAWNQLTRCVAPINRALAAAYGALLGRFQAAAAALQRAYYRVRSSTQPRRQS